MSTTHDDGNHDHSGSGPGRTTRRRVLQAAGLTAAGSLLPPSVHRAMAAPMPAGGLDAIEHVILLMQENRSFDHYFGTLKGVRGYGDRTPLRRRTGGTVLRQAGPDGDVLPFSLREAAATAGRPATDIQYLSALPHSFPDATEAWADGWWDQWVPAKSAGTMTYYDRQDIALQYELAETFTLCDAYHCSIFGSTNPNRNYFWTGTTGNEPGKKARAISNAAYDYDHAGYQWTTYPERLEAAGISWQIYQEWDNFTDNAVEYFRPFKTIGAKLLEHVEGDYRTTEEFYDSLHDLPAADQDRLLAQLEEGRAALTDAERSLFDRAMYRSRPGTLLERVRADIEAKTLPQVVWLVPPAALSEHPDASTPVGSANLIYDLLDLVASDLELWSSTATFLNFDENDGYFDHVPPPVPPRPEKRESEDWTEGQPIGLGPRVPMTVVSPWSIGGFVDSTVADHTSPIRFLERWTGIAEPNISRWRRDVCSDLSSAFDFETAHEPPALTEPGPIPEPITRWQPTPPDDQTVPVQEPGRRPSRALRYRPTVAATPTPDGLALTLGNEGSAAVSYTVYPFGEELKVPEHLLVGPDDTATLELPVQKKEHWDVVVQGPHQYWYELQGSLTGAAAAVDVRHGNADGHLRLDVINSGAETIDVRITPLGYAGDPTAVRLAAGTTESLEWPTDHGWYDLEVTAVSDQSFRRRITGRVETGDPSVTG